jgi:hypothetical protein
LRRRTIEAMKMLISRRTFSNSARLHPRRRAYGRGPRDAQTCASISNDEAGAIGDAVILIGDVQDDISK